MLTVYKSSAGAGKTFRLTGNFIDLLLSAHGRNRHRRILAVTFTKKATAEMKDRIIKELSRLARGEKSDHAKDLKEKHGLSDEQLQHQASEILTDLLQDYGAFAVTTIDSFFQQILRSFARELNLPGSYNLELDSGQILQTAVDDYFFNLSSDQQIDSFRALMRIVDENIEQSRAWNPKDTILTLGNELLKEKYQTHQKELEEKLSDPEALNHFQDSLRQILLDVLSRYLLDHRAEHTRAR